MSILQSQRLRPGCNAGRRWYPPVLRCWTWPAVAAAMRCCLPGVAMQSMRWIVIPLRSPHFAAIVVTNYLHRPLFPALMAALAPGGVLIYETFAQGNEAYGRPANPDFLLQRGELLRAVGAARVVAYEDLYVEQPKPAMVQRICAVVTAGVIGENPF